jgi:diaminohydroxyphosphoribosylaminopyrimidine deaminase/5-amino-6-(5-phosphoribosylamino)uracil reductase
MADFSQNDISFMKRALALSCQGLGRVAPNPSVGCVIVRDGQVVGEGRTADGGRPHAEVVALEMAGDLARDADVYVTLEPCAHTGETGPCALALVRAGVRRVFVACGDPDARVNGRGVHILREAGIEVIEGLMREEALAMNRGFFLKITEKRPFVTLKMAVSADGKIAGAGGQRVQISGAESHIHMHKEVRASHDAILVGMNTVIADNPLLTTRAEGIVHNPLRVVMGDPKKMPEKAHLAGQNDVLVVNSFDISKVLRDLSADHGVTRLLVEGGARVMRAFLDSGLWDSLYLYRSPVIIGADGLDAPDFGEMEIIERLALGNDVLEVYKN